MDDTTSDAPRSRRRRFLVAAGVLALAVAAAVLVLVLAQREGDEPAGGRVPAAEATDAPLSDEPLGEAGGVVLTGARVTDEIDATTGRPGAAVQRFAPGDTVRFWLAFDDSGAVAGRQTLFVTFTREGEEVFRTGFRLPQPTGQQNVALGSSQTQEPGEYRVIVAVDDEVIHETTFEVG